MEDMDFEQEDQVLNQSSRGRQRRKNTKYLDYEVGDQTRRSESELKEKKEAAEEVEAAPPRRPRGRPRSTPTPSEGPTPTKAVRGRKSPIRKTVKTPEDETPRPKRKYVKKQKVNVSSEVPAQPNVPEHEEEEEEAGGRRKRGAAKKALKYFHLLANDVLEDSEDLDQDAPLKTNHAQTSAARRGRKRKRFDSVSRDAAGDDKDFVPDASQEEEEDNNDDDDDGEEEEELEEEEDKGNANSGFSKGGNKRNYTFKSSNGISRQNLKIVLDSAELTQKFRKQNLSSCVFPEWIPSSSEWDLVPKSEVERFLPQELQSAAFKVSREGLQKEDSNQQRLTRFEALPAHPQRWDMMLFAGGPVWALEWCPTPDGSSASQYLAMAAHQGMDDLHYAEDTHSGMGLVQLWDVGPLDYNSRPQIRPSLAYALVLDQGFIWQMKFCPSGGWESPQPPRQVPLLNRLALLAVATSNGEVSIYSLPHPHALTASKVLPSGEGESPPVYKAAAVVTLKLGSLKAPRPRRSGMVLSLDWLPMKPHDVLAAGFYDGMVSLWNLSSQSSLLRLRDPQLGVTLLPYRCFLAHNHAVRSLAFCPASSHLLATAGDDRYVKMWDLRRMSDPVTSSKRFTTNEIHWLLNASGILLAMDVSLAAQSSRGLYYLDLCQRSLPVFPRTSTVWSVSYSDWLHSVLVCDAIGDVIVNLLPQMDSGNCNVKRHDDKRFPVFLSSLIPREEEEDEKTTTEQKNKVPEEEEETYSNGHVNFPKYQQASRKHCLQFTDLNTTPSLPLTRQCVWKQMKQSETKALLDLDLMNLSAQHKVRFNPNQRSHVWVASGGQAGLVRLMCLKNMITTHMKEVITSDQSHPASPDNTEAS